VKLEILIGHVFDRRGVWVFRGPESDELPTLVRWKAISVACADVARRRGAWLTARRVPLPNDLPERLRRDDDVFPAVAAEDLGSSVELPHCGGVNNQDDAAVHDLSLDPLMNLGFVAMAK
jgi:hypothetical protein